MSLPENRDSSTDPTAFDPAALRGLDFGRNVAPAVKPRIRPAAPSKIPDRKTYDKAMGNARSFFLMLGVLAFGYSAFKLPTVETTIDEHVDREILKKQAEDPEYVPDPAELATFRETQLARLRLSLWMSLGAGMLYLLLAAVLYRAPITALLIGTVTYIGFQISNLIQLSFQLNSWHLLSAMIALGLFFSLTTAIAGRHGLADDAKP